MVKNLVLDYWRQFDDYVLDPVVNKVYDRTEWDESADWVGWVCRLSGMSLQNEWYKFTKNVG